MTLNGVTSLFSAAAGTVCGTEHVRLGRNNQDGVAIGASSDAIAAAVTDGCSEGRYSEVGARLAAEWLAAWAPLEWRLCGEDAEAFAASITRGLETMIRRIASRFGVLPLAEVVADYFLFTFLVAVVGRERAAIVGMGDGLYAVDGHVRVLDAGPDNAPPYVAYRTVDVGRRTSLAADVHFAGGAGDFGAIAVATDGAADLEARASEPIDGLPQGGLSAFMSEPRYLRNGSLMHKRLQVIGRRCRRLPDDTTIATIVRHTREVA